MKFTLFQRMPPASQAQQNRSYAPSKIFLRWSETSTSHLQNADRLLEIQEKSLCSKTQDLPLKALPQNAMFCGQDVYCNSFIIN